MESMWRLVGCTVNDTIGIEGQYLWFSEDNVDKQEWHQYECYVPWVMFIDDNGSISIGYHYIHIIYIALLTGTYYINIRNFMWK